MIKAASLDIELDLLPISRALSQQNIRHRINEEGGQQAIWVATQAEAEAVVRLLTQVQLQPHSGSISSVFVSREQASAALSSSYRFAYRLFRVSPVSSILASICLCVAVVSSLGYRLQAVSYLFFPPAPTDSFPALFQSLFIEQSAGLAGMLQTLTPIFLHFGLLHLSFNLMWLFYFGVQLESRYPSWLMLTVVLVSSFCGNTFQFLYEGARNFGGMSGVVYGLIGFCFVLKLLVRDSRLAINNSMFAVFVASLVLMEVFASSSIASAAHLGGLVSGLFYGVIAGLYLNRRKAAA